jgi:hypothetical protein
MIEPRGEMIVRIDEVTGRTIMRLTAGDRDDKHTYYDICPWSPDGKHLLFSSADPVKVNEPYGDNYGTPNGQLSVMDLTSYTRRVIDNQALFRSHNGVFATWHPTRFEALYTKDLNLVASVDASTGTVLRQMKGSLRQLSPDGQLVVFPVNEPGAYQGRGIYMMSEDGSDLKQFLSQEELYDLVPNKDLFEIDEMTVGNTKWTPDAQHMLVTMWVHPRPHLRRSLFVVSRDGSEKRWLTYFGHHHSWTPDGKWVLYSGFKGYNDEGLRADPRLFLVSFDGSETKLTIDEPLGGHPIMDATSTMITTCDAKGVVLARLTEQTVEHVAAFTAPFDGSHQGTHAHCVWSPDNNWILYNSAETGNSQIYMVDIR